MSGIRVRSAFVLGCLLLLASLGRADDGWGVSLLRPDTLDGWTHGHDAPAGWTIAGGKLSGSGASTPLLSGWSFGDFELRLQWTADAGACKILFPEVPQGKGLELTLADCCHCGQLKDGDRELIAGHTPAGPAGKPHCAALHRAAGKLTLTVDGQPTFDVPLAAARRFGLGLAAEGKCISICELRLSEPCGEPLHNGKDLSEFWTPGDIRGWAAQDGAIVRVGHSGDYLRSKRTFGNFTFSCRYKSAKGTNSGVGIRTPRLGWPSGDGMELQIWDTPLTTPIDKHQALAIYGNVPPFARNDRSLEWNHVVIKADGYMISAWMNGQLVQQCNTFFQPELKWRNLKGWIGLQDHNGAIEFRDLRVLTAPDGLGLDAWYQARPLSAGAIAIERLMNSQQLAVADHLTSGVVSVKLGQPLRDEPPAASKPGQEKPKGKRSGKDSGKKKDGNRKPAGEKQADAKSDAPRKDVDAPKPAEPKKDSPQQPELKKTPPAVKSETPKKDSDKPKATAPKKDAPKKDAPAGRTAAAEGLRAWASVAVRFTVQSDAKDTKPATEKKADPAVKPQTPEKKAEPAKSTAKPAEKPQTTGTSPLTPTNSAPGSEGSKTEPHKLRVVPNPAFKPGEKPADKPAAAGKAPVAATPASPKVEGSKAVAKPVPKSDFVLAELQGPGAIVRVARTSSEGTLAFYFDGESQPRLVSKPAELWKQGPQLAEDDNPTTTFLPYRKCVKVVLQQASGAEYRIDYVTYAADVPLETFRDATSGFPRAWLPALEYRFGQQGGGTVRQQEPAPHVTSDRLTLGPGQVKPVAYVDGAGVVQWIRLDTSGKGNPPAGAKSNLPGGDKSAAPEFNDGNPLDNNDLWIEATIDNESQPAISAPARFWFGGLAGGKHRNYLLTAHPGPMLRLAMPFANGITLSLKNTGTQAIRDVGLTVAVAPATPATCGQVAGMMRLRGVFQPAGETGDALVKLCGTGRWVGLVYDQPAGGKPTGIASLCVDGQCRPGWAAPDLDAFLGYVWPNTHRATSGRHKTLAWRYLLLDSVDFQKELTLKANDRRLGDRLILYYAKPAGKP